ncbi:MAG: DUF502 domain-containing protein [Candidatus Omnitrophica bacterium]|nr:DUF502 domain-containing protein [Candidatus Omnitrophota bacterium]
MIAKLRDNFLAGIVVILPIAITLWLFTLIYDAVNIKILLPLTKFFKPHIASVYAEYGVRSVIFLLLIALVVLIGFATRIIFIRKLFSIGERLFFKIPMIGKAYVTIRQMSRAFLGDRKGIFKSAVLVEYPRKGVYSIGLLTSETKGEIQKKIDKKLVNIFIPTTPNPTSGILLMVPEDELVNLDMSVEEAMKLIVSGGMVAPGDLMENR